MSLFEPLWAAAFSLWGSPVSWAELLGFGLAVWMVVCNMRVNPLAWPLAIVSSVLYGLLFANSRLYGEAGLQGVFVVVAAWGWWEWLHGKQADGAALHVRWLSPRARCAVAGTVLLAWPLLGLLLDRVTDSDVPYFDAFPTAASLAGQWLLGRKYVENWPTWVIVNVVSVGLFAWKGLWLTVLLYALFAVMALAGWRTWQHRAAAA
jgi:nicotinamide mononucleotide transporter